MVNKILYEDNHLIIVNKNPGDIVQGDKTGDEPLSEVVKNYIKVKYEKPGNVYLAVVHRLDRPTSGVIAFARTSKAAARLTQQFQDRQTEKIYWAIVEGHPTKSRDKLVHYLKKNPANNKSYVMASGAEGAKKAVLSYEVLSKGDHYTLLEIKLETGRHHQIRCQLADIGHPIKGDLKYGAKRSNKDASICLHARSLQVDHPTNDEVIKVMAHPPKDALWDRLIKPHVSRR